MIIVKDLHKSFEDNQVLKGVSYHIHPGEKIVVVGPSGSGKSTFLRCLNLLERPVVKYGSTDRISQTPRLTLIKSVSIWEWCSSILICSITLRS